MSRSTVRNFAIACSLLLVVSGGFFYVYSKIIKEEAALEAQLIAIQTGNEREQTFNRLRKISEESQSDRDRLTAYFLPQVSESITFLNQVETIAPQNGISLKTDALDEGGDKKTKEKWVDAKFTFSGTRDNVERFIAILENLPYVSRMMSVAISARSQDNWEANVTVRVFIANNET